MNHLSIILIGESNMVEYVEYFLEWVAQNAGAALKPTLADLRMEKFLLRARTIILFNHDRVSGRTCYPSSASKVLFV